MTQLDSVQQGKHMIKKWLHKFAYAGCLPEDNEQQRLQKAIMVIAPSLISFFCIFWSSGYLYFDKYISAAIPGGYSIFSMASVLVFFKTRHYGFFRFSQIFLILCLPFLLQASLGGFRAGSAVQMWAMMAPIGAMMFQSTRAAAYWFIVFVLFTIAGGLAEPYLASHITPLPDNVITTFFVLNFMCAFFLIYICVHYFVSENKRILSIIREQTDKLMEMDQIKNRFFANLSHEFRTPLALTIGPLQDAIAGEFGDTDERLQKQLKVMLRNSQRLLRLINQLLDISKIESGEMFLNLEKCDVHQISHDLCLAFTPFAEHKQIEFICDAGEQALVMSCDSEKLEQVINNLLSNAIKFTPNAGKVKFILRKITKAQENMVGAAGIEIIVRDSGSGIAQDQIDKIFNRFYQVDGSSTRDYEGTGIGLSLIKELVELHSGQITVSSELGFGSEFRVLLPGKVTHDSLSTLSSTKENIEVASHIATTIEPRTNQSFNSEQDCILIVDDNSDIRDYLSTCLSPEFRVIEAEDGAEGLKQAQEHLPSLIISDIMMPGMDGYQLCNAIKSDTRLSHIPIIFLTAKASEEMKLEGLQSGADDYLAKPFSSRELLARSRNLIKLRAQEKSVTLLNQQLELKLKEQLDELVKTRRLTSYFSNDLLKRILNENDAGELITERRNITIFFCDLCNFTDMTDRMESEQATVLLNDYLRESVALVEAKGATVIQIIGDAIMAFFGAPQDMPNDQQASSAVELGLAIQEKVKDLSVQWKMKGMEFSGRSRIGIHQDYVTVGNFGSHNLMEYTAVGRGVNLAARLEASCTPGYIKVSHPVYLLTCDQFNYEPLVEEQFKGFARQLKVSELDPKKNAIS